MAAQQSTGLSQARCGRPLALDRLGDLRRAQGRFPAARDFYRLALAIKREMRNGYGLSITLTLNNLLYCLAGCVIGTLVGVLPGLGPVAAMLIQMAISRNREYQADASGAALSGDPAALASFIKSMGVYPPGSLVELSNGALGLVTSVNRDNTLRPVVTSTGSAARTKEEKQRSVSAARHAKGIMSRGLPHAPPGHDRRRRSGVWRRRGGRRVSERRGGQAKTPPGIAGRGLVQSGGLCPQSRGPHARFLERTPHIPAALPAPNLEASGLWTLEG